MRLKIVLISFILVYGLLIMPTIARSQTHEVKIKFVIDGQEVKSPKFKVLIYVDDQVIEPKITRCSFIVPSELSQNQKIDVHVTIGKYVLVFNSLTKLHFDSEWIIGMDNPPFNLQDAASPSDDGKELLLIYYIEFRPEKAEGTRWVIKVYK